MSGRRGSLLRLRRRPAAWAAQHPTWRAADPALIAQALRYAVTRPSGNWYVVGASHELRRGKVIGQTVGDREVVVWRPATAGRPPARGPARTSAHP